MVILGSGAADTTSNSFTGPKTVNQGTLNLEKAIGTNAVGGDVFVLGGTVAAGAKLTFARSGQIPSTSNVTVGAGGTIDFTNNPNPNYRSFTLNGGTVSNLGTITLNGSGTVLTLGNGVTLTGGIALTNAASATVRYNGEISGGSLTGAVNLGTTRRIFEVDDGAAVVDLTIGGAISGGSLAGGGFVKTGAGRLNLTNNGNSFIGSVVLNAGTLGVSNGNQLGATINAVILDGGTLASNATMTLGRTLTIGSSGGTINQSNNTMTI